MLSIGIGELQRNSSIFNNLSEEIQIVDKRRKKIVAMVYPVKEHSVVDKLAGKYRGKVANKGLSLEQVKEEAMMEAMREKYGLSS